MSLICLKERIDTIYTYNINVLRKNAKAFVIFLCSYIGYRCDILQYYGQVSILQMCSEKKTGLKTLKFEDL